MTGPSTDLTNRVVRIRASMWGDLVADADISAAVGKLIGSGHSNPHLWSRSATCDTMLIASSDYSDQHPPRCPTAPH